MSFECPHCFCKSIWRKGYYKPLHSQRFLRRYQCSSCHRTFSRQTTHPTYRQHRPELNEPILKLITNGVTLRASAQYLGCSRRTVEKKWYWLSEQAQRELDKQKYTSEHVMFDEMQTIERTKLLPITIALAVDSHYKILSVQVGRIPATGHLSALSRKKYGPRPSEKAQCLRIMFRELCTRLRHQPKSIISDQAPEYKDLVKKYFPQTPYTQVSSRGMVEKKREMLFLKQHKQVFDPMFALNQRAAKLRADIKRLTRRSWCVTQKIENLRRHLLIYQAVNNGLTIV